MARHLIIAFATVCCFALALSEARAAANPNWQLVFRYDSQSLELQRADRIPAVNKQIRTPGLTSAPMRVAVDLEWLDAAGRPMLTSTAELPLGIRSTLGDGEPCLKFIPDEGVVVIRVVGPDEKQAPQTVRFTRTDVVNRDTKSLNLPSLFENESWTFPLPSSSLNPAPAEGPISSVKIRDTGPDWNRLVIVVLSDGYIAANLSAGQFETAAGVLGSRIETKPPWDVLFAATNVYRVDIESNQQGTDHETYGVLKDTYLNSSFWVNDIERLLALTGNGYSRAVAAADAMVGPGIWDILLVLVNSTKYGGSGGGVAVSSINSNSSEIVIHELGHTFGELADEYETAYPGYPPGDWEPNVDYDYGLPGLKWTVWVEASTPLPTPETAPYYNVVGSFEGARYLTTGIYRPWYNCEMRSLNRPFCPVCQEAHVLEFTNMVSLTDEISPYPETSHTVDDPGVLFYTAPQPFNDLAFEWSLDGVPIPGESSSTLYLFPDQMGSGPQTLELTVFFNTELVRQEIISTSYNWTVTAAPESCCTGVVGDANLDGGYEPTVGDISTIIDHLFISGVTLQCLEEADANQSGGLQPTEQDITIGDISVIIDHLFISGVPLRDCF